MLIYQCAVWLILEELSSFIFNYQALYYIDKHTNDLILFENNQWNNIDLRNNFVSKEFKFDEKLSLLRKNWAERRL